MLRADLYPDNWMLMRVSVAYHVFSKKFQNVVRTYNNLNQLGEYDAILEYMEHVMGIWNVVNTKTPLHGESKEWADLVPHFEWFLNWHASCTHTADNTVHPSQFIPHQCWFDLRLTCTSLPLFTALYFHSSLPINQCLHIRHTNQDIVEGFFGIARGKSSDHNMDARLVMSVVRDQQIASSAAASAHGNTNRKMTIVPALKRRKGR